ncbi:17779_t:CDS:1, partial [Acaulospora morrowiae]
PPKEVITSSSSTVNNIKSSTVEESGEKDMELFELIKQFTNMGFTKSQAVEALEKYNYDLLQATNYLLDLQQN